MPFSQYQPTAELKQNCFLDITTAFGKPQTPSGSYTFSLPTAFTFVIPTTHPIPESIEPSSFLNFLTITSHPLHTYPACSPFH